MNAPNTLPPVENIGKLAANQSVIRGRILEVRRTDKAVYTDVTLPAPDSYSSPQTVRIVSGRFIGKPGEDITARVFLKGYRRKYKDKDTGEDRFGNDISLSLIED